MAPKSGSKPKSFQWSTRSCTMIPSEHSDLLFYHSLSHLPCFKRTIFFTVSSHTSYPPVSGPLHVLFLLPPNPCGAHFLVSFRSLFRRQLSLRRSLTTLFKPATLLHPSRGHSPLISLYSTYHLPTYFTMVYWCYFLSVSTQENVNSTRSELWIVLFPAISLAGNKTEGVP